MKSLVIFFMFVTASCFSVDTLPYCDSVAVWNYCKNYLPNDPVIIECGACNGADTAHMANIWPEATIHSFEPVPYLFSELQKSAANYPKVHIYNIALGDFCGKATFHVSKHSNGDIAGASSLLAPKMHLEYNDEVSFKETIQVEVLRLDRWARINKVRKVDYLWLDMQGYELNMLKVSKLAKKAKVIYIEVELSELYAGQYLYKDVLAWMEENNFELKAIDFDVNTTRDFGNAVFVKKQL